MQFVKTTSTAAAAQKLVEGITAALERGEKVLWLVSGGSAINVAVEVQRLLPATPNLLIMQVDERFGAPGHANSNWQQLLDAGFSANKFHAEPILRNLPLKQTVETYQALLGRALTTSYVVGLFGIGADGHTAGILPQSPAVHELLTYASSYQGPDFQRITITPAAFAHIQFAVAYAMGTNKAAALQNLQTGTAPQREPAQLLKEVPEMWIYNDQIGEAA